MEFEKVESWKMTGTFFVDNLVATYDDLVKVFGKPYGPSSDGKTRFNWVLEFGDGTLATIYDYKHPPFDGSSKIVWHVGGHNNAAWRRVISRFYQD